jgi:hypothetical protein
VTGCCEYRKEYSGAIKGRHFIPRWVKVAPSYDMSAALNQGTTVAACNTPSPPITYLHRPTQWPMTDHTASTSLIRSQTQHNCLYDIQGDPACFTGPLLRALKRQRDNNVLQNTSSLVDPSHSSLSYSAQNPNTVALSYAYRTGALAAVQLCLTVWGHASRETFWQHKFQHFSQQKRRFEQSVFWDVMSCTQV